MQGGVKSRFMKLRRAAAMALLEISECQRLSREYARWSLQRLEQLLVGHNGSCLRLDIERVPPDCLTKSAIWCFAVSIVFAIFTLALIPEVAENISEGFYLRHRRYAAVISSIGAVARPKAS